MASFAGTTIPATITGLGGVTVPATAVESPAGRVGFDSTVVDGTGNGPQPAVAPLGGATVQETVTALNSLGIKVIGLGPNSVPTNNTTPTLDPSTFFSALGRLTGTLDPATGEPIVVSTSVSDSQFASAVASSIHYGGTPPVSVSLSPGTLPAGLTFTPAPGTAANLQPGASATFNVTLGVSSLPYNAAFNVNFVDAATGTVLGTIPFQVNLPGVPVTGSPASMLDPPTIVSGLRVGRPMQPATIVITYSAEMNPGSVQDVNSYILKGPGGRTVAIASATYNPATNAVTLRTRRRLSFQTYYRLEILGQGPLAVRNTQGVALDGMRTGTAGDNYYGVLRSFRLTPVSMTSARVVRKSALNLLARSRPHHR